MVKFLFLGAGWSAWGWDFFFDQGVKSMAFSKSSLPPSMWFGISTPKFKIVLHQMVPLLCTTIATICIGKFATMRSREPFRKPAFLCTQWDWVLVPGKTVSWTPAAEILCFNLPLAQLLLLWIISIAFGDTAWHLYIGVQRCHEWIVTFFSTS